MQYHAVIHKDDNSCYGVIVPDLPGCYSAGDTLEQASINAKEAIVCHLEGMLLDEEPIPQSSVLDKLVKKKEYKGGIWILVDVDLSKISGKAKRINVTIPERVLRQIDIYQEQHGGNRSAFLTQAALEFIRTH